MVRLTGVSRRFGSLLALDGVDLEVARGECVGLVGPNGSGCTTLLLLIATLVAPSSGRIDVDGIDAVADPFSARTRVAFAGDLPPYGGRLTVAEYLEFVRQARRARTALTPAPSVAALLTRAGLDGTAPVDRLSSGLRRRLTLAAAIGTDAELLVLDRPLDTLDDAAHRAFLEWLGELHAGGRTLIVAPGRDAELRRLCTRTVGLDRGRVTTTHGRGDLVFDRGTRAGAAGGW